MDKNISIKIFIVLAWFVSIYHLILGIIGTFAPQGTVISIAQSVFGVAIEATPQFFVLSKFIAALFIMLGITMAFVAKNPQKHGHLAWAVIVYFAIRIFNRISHFSLLNEAFGTTMQRNIMTVIPILIIAIGLIICMPRGKS